MISFFSDGLSLACLCECVLGVSPLSAQSAVHSHDGSSDYEYQRRSLGGTCELTFHCS